MKYKRGDKIEFSIYGTIIKGIIIKDKIESVEIRITDDWIKRNIGTINIIHKSHKHCIIKNK